MQRAPRRPAISPTATITACTSLRRSRIPVSRTLRSSSGAYALTKGIELSDIAPREGLPYAVRRNRNDDIREIEHAASSFP